jgi:hypothetical protein
MYNIIEQIIDAHFTRVRSDHMMFTIILTTSKVIKPKTRILYPSL